MAALALMASLTITAYAGTTYKALIVQGNTEDIGDCKVFYQNFQALSNGNIYVTINRGWHYMGSTADGELSFHNYSRWPTLATSPQYALASAQDLIDAKDYDVLYWSGHGDSMPARLNVHAGSDYGPGIKWAVLCYQCNSNQNYHMPGFSADNYTAPMSNDAVYRFWYQFLSPPNGQEMTTGLADDELPLEITVSNGNGRSVGSVGATIYREMNDDHQGNLDNEAQRELAEDYIDEKYQSGIEGIGTVYCEEIDEETGAVPGTQSEVGKIFCYSNQYSGIRLVNNFYKVATDATGVYYTIDRWKDVAGCSDATTGNTSVLSPDSIAVPCAEGESVEHTEMVYVPISATTYQLCYEVTLSDGSTYYADAVTGETVDLFVEDLRGVET